MNDPKDILDSWIMIEHLDEGAISLDNRKSTFSNINCSTNNNYYDYFKKTIENNILRKAKNKKMEEKNEDGDKDKDEKSDKEKNEEKDEGEDENEEINPGLVLYFNLFSFDSVIDILKKSRNLVLQDEDIDIGNRFSFAIYFDRNLKLINEKTFFSESYYILLNKDLPEFKAFEIFESKEKAHITNLFNNAHSSKYTFNKQFKELLKEYNINLKMSRMKPLLDVDSEQANFHSFFISDLYKAKNKLDTSTNLMKYLSENIASNRVNLDIKKNFNDVRDILKPSNYPLTRFPANHMNKPFLMQQAAINIAVMNEPSNSIFSVNGPPGTGKTTLLRDIFAHLIVEQSKEIIDHANSNAEKINHLGVTIDKLPKSISDKGILVASSNNGAVQNIVSELPLNDKVDTIYLEELKHVNYFADVVNKNLEKTKYWALFSKEGGRKSNVNDIMHTIEEVIKSLDNTRPNLNAYNDFNKAYKNILDYRTKKQNDLDSGNITNPLLKYDLNKDSEVIQKSNPFVDDEYMSLQADLFIKALAVRKEFLLQNINNIKTAYKVWNNKDNYDLNSNILIESWYWINMVIPVISTTFASVSNMFNKIDKEFIGYLFVDEAGQALPQACVGSIFRSKKVIVVGDPAQIKPVITLDSSILRAIANKHNVSDSYVSSSSSVQTIIDNISKYGFEYEKSKKWVGIPLWVHIRCKDPMFSLSNDISYENNMVIFEREKGKAYWYDICGKADNKYIKEQADALIDALKWLIRCKEPDKYIEKNIYIISPFKNVIEQLKIYLSNINLYQYVNNKKIKVNTGKHKFGIGTVHTFQGKEAPIVFLILGCDKNNVGAAQWAVGSNNPNIMNVAATRAKEEFYIIGDYLLFKSLKSEVIDKTMKYVTKRKLTKYKSRSKYHN